MIKEFVTGHKAEHLATLGYTAYGLARAAEVQHSIAPYTDVNAAIFLAIELGTIPTLVYGGGDVVRSMGSEDEKYTATRRFGSSALAAASILAPYAYVGIEGYGMPAQAWAGTAGLLAMGGLSVAFKKAKDRFKNRGTQEQELDPVISEL